MATLAPPRRATAPPETPLDETSIRRYDARTSGPTRIYEATSACGRWHYLRVDAPTTPWRITYTPTGQQVDEASLPKARRWTASPHAVAHLVAVASDVVARDGAQPGTIVLAAAPGGLLSRAEDYCAADRLAEAHQWLAVHARLAARDAAYADGRLAADDPDSRCACGGYLIERAELRDDPAAPGGRRWVTVWRHADCCPECVDQPAATRPRCALVHGHEVCDGPDPVLCGHVGCAAPATAVPVCSRGHDTCCGCCGASQ